MKKAIWAAMLLAVSGVTVPFAIAQETTWRLAERPAPPPRIASTAPQPKPTATLGRPVRVTRGASPLANDPPRPFPPAYRQGPPLVTRTTTGVEPIATVAPLGGVIAASFPAPTPAPGPTPSAEEILGIESFASDRLLPSNPKPAPFPVKPADFQPLGDWKGLFPTLPQPQPQAQPLQMTDHATAVAQENPYASDLPPTKWWVKGEYLLWWIKNDTTPPLVTTGNLDQPGTRVLFGGDLERNPFSGGRFTAGYYLDDCGQKAVELSGFWLGRRSDGFMDSTFTNAFIRRPFQSANTGQETGQIVSQPNVAIGKISIDAPSELWGAEANMLCQWCCGCDWRLDPLVGFRYLNLRESITIREDVLVDPNLRIDPNDLGSPLDPTAGARLIVTDRFATRNQFYGGQIGIEGRWQRERLTLDGRIKLAFGITNQVIEIAGNQDVTFRDGTRANFTGGLLALNSNIGRYERDRYSFVPEAGVTLGYYFTERLRGLVGYNFLYWSNVVRPGDQIDRVLDENRIPNFNPIPAPPAAQVRPIVPFKHSDFWAQGLTIGLEYRY